MAGRVPPSNSMGRVDPSPDGARRSALPAVAEQQRAAAAALADARASGTVAIGDIGNTLVAADVLAETAMPAVLFHELIGFLVRPMPGRGRTRVHSCHGSRPPARVSGPRAARAVLRVARPLSRDRRRGVIARPSVIGPPGRIAGRSRVSVTGRGEMARDVEVISARGTTRGQLRGATRPATSIGWACCAPGLLAVHCTQLTPSALARVAERGCVVVSCPRSNRWVGAGDPPLDSISTRRAQR